MNTRASQMVLFNLTQNKYFGESLTLCPTKYVDFSIEDGGTAAVPGVLHTGTLGPSVLARVELEDEVTQLVRLIIRLVLRGEKKNSKRKYCMCGEL